PRHEARLRQRRQLLAQAVAGDVIAHPGAPQLAVVVEPAQQEAQFLVRQFAVDAGRKVFTRMLVWLVHVCSSRSDNNGRNFSSIASRARKMRERTVPIGQPIASAISS